MRLPWLLAVGLLLAGCAGRGERIDTAGLREGDLAFRRGTGTKSRAVLAADSKGLYSHIGVVVENEGQWCVIHVTPGEDSLEIVKCEPVEAFFSPRRASRGCVMRLRDGECAAGAARTLREILDRRVEFDHDYDLADSAKMYCTELVWRAFARHGCDLSQGRRSELNTVPLFRGIYIFPSDIIVNDNLSEVSKFDN